jgi:hydrogenase maturation protease
MKQTSARCLVLACGNTLREDDGIGPWLAHWTEDRFAKGSGIRVIVRQQWTPDLAEDIAHADSVLFIDCSIESVPGSVQVRPIDPAPAVPGLATHHIASAELLALSQELYNSVPGNAYLFTVGAGSTELREGFTGIVTAALPEAYSLLEFTVQRLLINAEDPLSTHSR